MKLSAVRGSDPHKLGTAHQDNKMKVSCTDQGSGVDYFSAREVVWHDNSTYGANDGYSVNGSTLNNTDGSALSFMATSAKLQPRNWSDVHIYTTCRDKAGNEETDADHYFNATTPPNTRIYGSLVPTDLEVNTSWTGAICEDSCKLRKYRDTTAGNCSSLSYECSCYDTPCGSTNSGMGRTCCLSGSDPYYGCKTHSDTLTPFGEYLSAQPYMGNASAKYVQLDTSSNVYYVLPDRTKDDEYTDYVAHCRETGGCNAGYLCLHFNCYVDRPTDSFPKLFVCGNYY